MPAPFPLPLLVDLPNWVGDQLMALPAVQRLVAANAGAPNVLHSRPATRRLIAAAVPAATVVASPRRASPFRVAWSLRRQFGRFAMGISLRNAARAKILLRLSSRHAWGSRGQGSLLLLDRHFPVDRSLHQVHDGDPMLAALGVPAVDELGYGVRLSDELVAEGARSLAACALPAGLRVGLAPASALGAAKRWPLEHFGTLARALRRRGMCPVVLIGPGEEDFATAIAAAAGWQLPAIGVDLDVAGLAAVLHHLDALVSIDSGPMHLAAAVGTPVVALFGPTELHRTAPLGAGHRVIRHALDCRGCGATRCPVQHGRCMVDLTPTRVEHELLAMCAGAVRGGLNPGIPNGGGHCG